MRMPTAGHNIPAWAEPPHFITHLSLHHALVVMFHLLVIIPQGAISCWMGEVCTRTIFHCLLFCSKEEYFRLL